jgi:rubrerythrin
MLRATERAARDEARHARATERIARRYGGSPRRPRIQRSTPRSLEALAIDNTIEGCVRETYGAALAMWQAQKAKDPKVRAAMDRIARDETRHAALSWQIARWAEPRLAVEERARVEGARRVAIRELHRELTREPDAALIREAGLPRADEALRLLASLNRELWSGRANPVGDL